MTSKNAFLRAPPYLLVKYLTLTKYAAQLPKYSCRAGCIAHVRLYSAVSVPFQCCLTTLYDAHTLSDFTSTNITIWQERWSGKN